MPLPQNVLTLSYNTLNNFQIPYLESWEQRSDIKNQEQLLANLCNSNYH